ncbi:MAG: hypothetical protein HY319_11200 [Armatimonadetes bacterium]|nr:hypothetical protein [Armatimonadota bacterium]
MPDIPDLQRTIEELARDLAGLNYRGGEQEMRELWRLAWLLILDQAEKAAADPRRLPRALGTVTGTLKRTVGGSLQWLNRWLPDAWRAGMRQGQKQFQDQEVRVGTSFNLVHQRGVEAVVKDSFGDLLAATQKVETRVKRSVRQVVKAETEGLLTTGRRADRHVAKRIADRLVEEQIFGVTAKNGRWTPMEEYARLVAHTKLRQSHTEGLETLLQEHGFDLVQISAHVHKPDLCTPLEGKVFSLSGEDDRFPRLPRHTPFHPGCRHVETPFVDTFRSEAELNQLRAQSATSKPINITARPNWRLPTGSGWPVGSAAWRSERLRSNTRRTSCRGRRARSKSRCESERWRRLVLWRISPSQSRSRRVWAQDGLSSKTAQMLLRSGFRLRRSTGHGTSTKPTAVSWLPSLEWIGRILSQWRGIFRSIAIPGRTSWPGEIWARAWFSMNLSKCKKSESWGSIPITIGNSEKDGSKLILLHCKLSMSFSCRSLDRKAII